MRAHANFQLKSKNQLQIFFYISANCNAIPSLPESFTRKQEYGLTLLMSTDKKVSKFISDILAQVKDWLEKKQVRSSGKFNQGTIESVFIQVKKLVVVLLNVDTNEVLERWEFNIEIDDDAKEAAKENIGGNNTEKLDAKAGSVKQVLL